MPAVSGFSLLGSSSFFDANVRSFSFPAVVSVGEFSAAFRNSGCSDLVYAPGTAYINCEPATQLTCSSSSDSPVCATAVSVRATSNVPDYGFSSSSTLLAVEIGAAVNSIGKSAFNPGFSNYGSIETVTFEARTAHLDIGERAFMAADKLERLVLNSGTVDIGVNAFAASGVVSANLAAVETISSGAFDFSVYLTEVKFGVVLKTIGVNAFLGCTSLLSVVFPTTTQVLEVYSVAFLNCTSLARVEFEQSAELEAGVFAGCVNLHTVVFQTVPSGMQSKLERSVFAERRVSLGR